MLYQNNVDNIDKKLKNATEFLEEIDEHKKEQYSNFGNMQTKMSRKCLPKVK